LACSIGFLIYKKSGTDPLEDRMLSEVENDIILPNSNSALLTLADGRTILIDDSLQGIIAGQDGIQVGRKADGSVYYEAAPSKLGKQVAFNSFSTPKGNTFQLQLADGTKVWLNSETTLRFPLAF